MKSKRIEFEKDYLRDITVIAAEKETDPKNYIQDTMIKIVDKWRKTKTR